MDEGGSVIDLTDSPPPLERKRKRSAAVTENKVHVWNIINNSFQLYLQWFSPHFLENYFAEVKIKKLKMITNHF